MLLPLAGMFSASCSSGTPSAPRALTVADATRGDASREDENSMPLDARAESAVRQADAAEVGAFLSNDPATLARLWADDFVVTNPFNQFVTKQQVLALVTSGILAFSAYERHIEYMHNYGRVMIVAGSETVVWAGRMPLTGQTSHLRYTSVWARRGNEWREVARHASLILSGAPGGPPIGT
jgi:ketosteroid isomerase-like protein